MAKRISLGTREEWARQSVGRPPVVLLEVTHPAITEPVRLAAGNSDVSHQSFTYAAVGLEVLLPDEGESGLPRARVSISNVGKELTQWAEASQGGRGAAVKLMVAVREEDGSITVEWQTELRISSIELGLFTVEFELGYQDLLNLPAVSTRFDPSQAPALFE